MKMTQMLKRKVSKRKNFRKHEKVNVSKLIDKCRQIEANEEQQHLKRIRSNGYTIVEEALSNQLVNQLLLMVRQQFNHQKKDSLSQVPAEWEADWILNLQNKDKEFIDLLDLPCMYFRLI